MRVWSPAGNYISGKIGTLRRIAFHIAELGLHYPFVSCFDFQRNTGSRERDFPGRSTSFSSCKHPGLQRWEIEVPRLRQCVLVECLFSPEKFGNRECRIFSERQIKTGDIETGEVHAVVEAMAIRILPKECVVPSFELATEHQAQFQM